jgi:hypothetical protein
MHATSTTTKQAGGAPIGEPIEWAPRLEAILAEQRRVCGLLEQLSAQQGEQIRAGETGALLRVIGERQELVNQLSRLNAELEPYRREWDWCMGRLATDERERMEHAVRELGGQVDRIWARDEADKAELEQQRAAVSSELTGISRGRVAMSAYGVRRDVQAPMFQDRSC